MTRLTRLTRLTRETRVAASVLPDSFEALAAGAFGEIFLSATIVTSPLRSGPLGLSLLVASSSRRHGLSVSGVTEG